MTDRKMELPDLEEELRHWAAQLRGDTDDPDFPEAYYGAIASALESAATVVHDLHPYKLDVRGYWRLKRRKKIATWPTP